MADAIKKQMKELEEKTTVADDDIILIQETTDSNKKVTKANLLKEINADKTTILNTIGNEEMGTTATTLKGAVKELDNKIKENTSQLKDIANSGYFDIAKDMKGADYKTIKENGFYRNVTGTPTTGTGGVLLVISNTDKWSVAYKWLSISNTVITEYNACKDGDNYEEWKQLSTTKKQQLTLLNGWMPYDVQPMIVICGNLLCVNMRIKSGTYTTGTLIAETGKVPVGGGGNYFQATDVSGNKIGSVSLTDTGRIEIVGAFSHNADVSINFTATIN